MQYSVVAFTVIYVWMPHNNSFPNPHHGSSWVCWLIFFYKSGLSRAQQRVTLLDIYEQAGRVSELPNLVAKWRVDEGDVSEGEEDFVGTPQETNLVDAPPAREDISY